MIWIAVGVTSLCLSLLSLWRMASHAHAERVGLRQDIESVRRMVDGPPPDEASPTAKASMLQRGINEVEDRLEDEIRRAIKAHEMKGH